jgi:hypothetical protein
LQYNLDQVCFSSTFDEPKINNEATDLQENSFDDPILSNNGENGEHDKQDKAFQCVVHHNQEDVLLAMSTQELVGTLNKPAIHNSPLVPTQLDFNMKADKSNKKSFDL